MEEIHVEKGEHFVAINEGSNTLYVSNNKSNSITVIDCSSHKIIGRIEIKRPRKLVVNLNNNTLFVISDKTDIRLRGTGAKISVIDILSNKIIETIGEKEGFSDIGLNEETNIVYATQPKSKLVWAINGHTYNVVDKIKTDEKYHVLSVDSITNRIFLGGEIFLKTVFSQIDLSNNKISKIGNRRFITIESLFFSHTHNKLYFHWNTSGDNVTYSSINQIDLNSNSFGDEIEFGRCCVYFDSTRNMFYLADYEKRKIEVLDHKLSTINSFQYQNRSIWEKLKETYEEMMICIHPKTDVIYLIGRWSGNILYAIKE